MWRLILHILTPIILLLQVTGSNNMQMGNNNLYLIIEWFVATLEIFRLFVFVLYKIKTSKMWRFILHNLTPIIG